MRTLIIILIFLFCLLLTLPAKVVYQWLSSNLSIQIAGIDGSIFNGHAQQLNIPVNKNEQLKLQQINWTFNPLNKIINRKPVKLHFNHSDLKGNIKADVSYSGKLTVQGSFSQMNVAILNPLLNNLAFLRGSSTKLAIRNFAIDNTQLITALDTQLTSDKIHINSVLAQLDLEKIKLSAKLNEQQEIIIQLTDMSEFNAFNIQFTLKQQANYLQILNSSGYILDKSQLAKQLKDFLPLFAKKQAKQWQIQYNFSNMRISL